MLGRALEAFTRLEVSEFALKVVVVENDDEPRVGPVLEDFRDRLDITFAHEPRPGICRARNRALDVAFETGADWIATTDDDNYPDPDWLVRLLDVTRRFPEAEAVSGDVRVLRPEGARWRMPMPEGRKRQTGDVATYMGAANFMISRALVDPEGGGFRFDLGYNLTGGEDLDFLLTLKGAGKKVIWTREAIVNVPVEAGRSKTGKAIQRRILAYAQVPSILRKHRGFWVGSAKVIRRILRMVLRALMQMPGALVAWGIGRQDAADRLMDVAGQLLAALGLMLGFWGFRGRPYRKTDGN